MLIFSSATMDSGLSSDELQRYQRQLILPELGIEGQTRLRDASVLIVGAGGLGSPAALYLAAAGIGRLGLVDPDRVEIHNLHRQILHSEAEAGKTKVESAARRLGGLNSQIRIEVHQRRIVAENALNLIREYDLILDGSDNFPTRYLVNDACVLLNRPLIYGAILGFEGQLSVFHYKGGACYRCIFAEPPPATLVPGCAEGGVIGPLPGVIGALQATEAIKIICGIGEPMRNRLLLYDARRLRFREIELQRDPGCAVCGDSPVVRELIDYDAFCQAQAPRSSPANELTSPQLAAALGKPEELTILDVRNAAEFAYGHLAGSISVPLSDLERRVDELERTRRWVVVCRTGLRSAQAAVLLKQKGFSSVQNLSGGLLQWREEFDPELPVL